MTDAQMAVVYFDGELWRVVTILTRDDAAWVATGIVCGREA